MKTVTISPTSNNHKVTHTRYDWNSLKLKFFVSRNESIRGFLEEEMGMKENGNTRKMTFGWSEERENFRQDVFEQAKISLKGQIFEEIYKPSLQELGEMHQEIVWMLKMSLTYIKQTCVSSVDGKGVIMQMPDINALNRIWNIIKTEKWEQTKFLSEPDTYILNEADLGE